MQPSSRKARELKSTVLVKHKEAVLSNLEQSEVEKYEENKLEIVQPKGKKNANETNFQFTETPEL